MVKNLHVTLEEDVYAELKEEKGDRTWEEALKEQFNITDTE